MKRVTARHLESAIVTINHLLRRPETKTKLDENGRAVPQPGHFFIHYANGKAAVCMVTRDGGSLTFNESGTRREAHIFLSGMITAAMDMGGKQL